MSGWGAAGAAGIGIAGGLLDSFARLQGIRMQNDANRQLAIDQRTWNEQMWQRQNQYNHPQEQMARLSEAGLNPRLIYNTGASSAVGTASDVKGYDRAEAKNVMEGFNAFSNTLGHVQMAAQTNNVEAMTNVANQEAIVKSYEALNKAVDIDRKKFDLGVSKELRDFSIQAAAANATQAVHNARKSASEADVSVNTKDWRIKQAKTQLEIAQATKRGKDLDNAMKNIESFLNDHGISRGDNVIFRLILMNPHLRPLLEELGFGEGLNPAKKSKF